MADNYQMLNAEGKTFSRWVSEPRALDATDSTIDMTELFDEELNTKKGNHVE